MKIALQLYSVIEKCMTPADLKKTLTEIGAMGYDGVEFMTYGAYGTVNGDVIQGWLEQAGLKPVNVHITFEHWFSDISAQLKYAKEIGVPSVTFPWIPFEARSPALYREIIRRIPEWIALCKDFGLNFCYHNHNFEFDSVDGQVLLYAIAAADAEAGMELDTFWCHFAGFDPVAVMRELGSKLKFVHIKDYNELADFGKMRFTAIGAGIMNNQAVVDQMKVMGIDWVIVEQDNSDIDTLESARISVSGVKKLL